MKLTKREVELIEKRISMDKQVMSVLKEDSYLGAYIDAKAEAALLTRILNESEKPTSGDSHDKSM